MTLLALQREFRAALLAEKGDRRPAIGSGREPGLAVYHHAYRAQLIDCLREAFPQLRKWLGDDEFTEAALGHIAHMPPHGWTLGVYGEGFDATLATLYPNDAEVAELAWLEWAMSQAFSGKNAARLAPEALAQIDWETARLRFTPTVCIGVATINVGAIWSALSAERDPPPVEPIPGEGALLVWREAFSPCFRTIDGDEHAALVQALSGETFEAICARLVGEWGEEQGVAKAGSFLGQWVRDGLIADA